MAQTIALFPDMVGTSEDAELIETGYRANDPLTRELAQRLDDANDAISAQLDDVMAMTETAKQLLSWLRDVAPFDLLDNPAIEARMAALDHESEAVHDWARGLQRRAA
jgi:hypothetical protein